MNPSETFFTSIGCMDGTCQEAMLLFGQERFGAQYGDNITEENMVTILTRDDISDQFLGTLKKKIEFSLKAHRSKGIIVYGHVDCSEEVESVQKENVLLAVDVIKSLIDDPEIPIIPAFVDYAISGDLADYEAFEIQAQDLLN